MASVSLDALWIHLGSDLSTSLVLDLDGASVLPTRPLSVRTYGDGRQAMVVGPGRPQTADYRLEQVARADYEQLVEWIGELLLFRDPRGRAIWGTYRQVLITDIAAPDEIADVQLTVVEVTVEEGV